jgi:putative heme-binding domain-containing protein
VLDGVLASTERTGLLMDELAAGRIKPGEIDAPRADLLLRHGDAAIRTRAAELLGAAPADRQKALADYRACLKLTADPTRGRQIFAKHCANCHRVGDLGVNVAPDISDSRVKSAEQYLTDILQPNRAIDSNYVSYTVVTTDGRTVTGVLSQETATSITLRQAEDKTVTLPRSEIEEMRSNGVSLMPDGLEKDIPHQDMADLVAFIKNWRYLDGLTPLGATAP